MLILPLHRPLTRETFPFATAFLMLCNVLVFFLLQSQDGEALARAQQHYAGSGIADYEVPAFAKYLERAGRRADAAQLAALPETARASHVAIQTLTDVSFRDALHRGELFDTAGALEAWRPLRARYEQLQDEVFTLRHMLRSSEWDPWRMLASAFLHGGVMHLAGNLLFLAALGLLVEGALGAWRFLGVYVLGALGSSAVSLLWRWGDTGGGLGASGAIAALMGAFCVLWGREPVRFFYWFFVVFDYVRAPAILLLPVWLGWEVFNLFSNPDLGIGFDAHAGGLLTGALLGVVLVATRHVRRDFIAGSAEPAPDPRWEQALQHLGRMQVTEAESLLAALAAESPQRVDVAIARFRAARLSGALFALQQRARELLARTGADQQLAPSQVEALAELRRTGAEIDPALRADLLARWIERGELERAEAELGAEPGSNLPDLAPIWFRLALAWRERGEHAAMSRVLRGLLQRFPGHALAHKAHFLLQQGG